MVLPCATYFSNSKAEENRNYFAFAATIPPNDLSVGLQGRKMLGYGGRVELITFILNFL